MRDFEPSRRTSGHVRPLAIGLVLMLLMAFIVAPAPAQGQTGTDQPTDAELAAKLKPVIVNETRVGDAVNITVDLPIGSDTFTTSNRPATNWSLDQNMRVGFNQANGNGAQRMFMFFDVSSIPANATVQSAELRVFMNNFSPSGDQPMGLLARFLTSPWDASILTWNNFNPSWGAEIGIAEVPATTGWVRAFITAPVAEWVSGARANHGIMVMGDETPQQRERVFTTINANNANFPRLRVTYQIDTTPPTSSVTALPQWSPGTFTVSWTGQDNPGGSGIRHYDVQVRTNGGAWQAWQTATTQTSASFTGSNGNLHEFRVRAVDLANNIEAFPGAPETGTTVDTVPPNATANALPPYTFANTFNVTWGGTDTGSGPNGGSGIAHFDVQFQLNGGAWTPFLVTTTATMGTVTNATAGQVYAFRARAVDRVGNIQTFSGNAQAQTTISLGDPVAFITPFNPPVTMQNTFNVQWQGEAAPGASIVAYDVQFSFNGGPWQAWLNNVGGTSAQFTAAQGDGVYAFQVRARDNAGRTGTFHGGPASNIAVDVVAPHITVQVYQPVATDN